MRRGLLLWIGLVLVISCNDKPAKITRQDCAKVADHIAAIMVDHCISHTDECWDAEVGQAHGGVPAPITKATFQSFLQTAEGKTWLMQRQGQWRSLNETAIPGCIEKGSSKLVRCLLAAKTHDDVTACDKSVDGDPPTTPK